MPRETASDRRARRAKTALQWAQWLTAAMDAENIRTFELVERGAALGATFESGGVTHWRNGDNTADAEQSLIVARALHRDPVEALRAAGHDAIADEMESQAGHEATTRREIALQWSIWAHDKAADAHIDLAELPARSDGDITPANVADWTVAKRAAISTEAICVAVLLGADPFDALRAAGHGRLAAQIQAINAADRAANAPSRAEHAE